MDLATSIDEKRPPFLKRSLTAVGLFFTGTWLLVRHLSIRLAVETGYWTRLFFYTSKQFLRLEGYLSLAGALVFYGLIFVFDLATSPRVLLDYSYIFFTLVMVLLSMNLLPRERDQGTLEILWSQPIRRSHLVLIQLFSLTLWILILALFAVLLIREFTAYPEGAGMLLLFVCTTSFAVGAFTVLVSTFCRHAIATGLVALLILGAHYFWIKQFGPIMFFYNPVGVPQMGFIPMLFDICFNRIMLLMLVGFILDYLFRRLRRTAEWFT